MEAIGRYRVQRRIGAGAFSTVWQASDDELAVPVAIKIIAENWLDHADVCGRFLDEARLLRRITDPRVIGVYDIGRLPDGRAYFVMDYADRGTVQDLCAGPLPPAEALRLGAEIAEAVEVLHQHGVIHRDLKPANLLLASGIAGAPRVVLADLGMAKRLAEASGLTMAVGTPGYMAPEQAHGRLPLDQRVDVYGIAAVVHVLLTGRRPFEDETSIADVAVRPADRTPAPLASELGLPPTVDAFLHSALSAAPDHRPPTAAALAAQLRCLAAELEDTQRLRRPFSARGGEGAESGADRTGSGAGGLPVAGLPVAGRRAPFATEVRETPSATEAAPTAPTPLTPSTPSNPPTQPTPPAEAEAEAEPGPEREPAPAVRPEPTSRSEPTSAVPPEPAREPAPAVHPRQSLLPPWGLALASLGLAAVLAVATWLALSLVLGS
ncbi:serine/threonine protein kinase [Streptomyces albus]|uniref:non-specific serine/threonine protein kinase n=1 Tax=Streptomyces albus (strain ATCC 21838 / DSM 41398 / FERM P-419 / JCM 4703 / NBRC 107858) TaxID=1081613 RepID=A0A0B5ERV8_STRA4|nr:serine/threonine protein kinase [Streptomyces albus]AOU79867.1 serine/threonine protein kinase [Streptomyces albus]AYN35590.1 serine/threonine protein kinase [Streptomyces albus]